MVESSYAAEIDDDEAIIKFQQYEQEPVNYPDTSYMMPPYSMYFYPGTIHYGSYGYFYIPFWEAEYYDRKMYEQEQLRLLKDSF